jgi:DNA polymerase I-like protein with 3'-5' exonuclease and polymerase domains
LPAIENFPLLNEDLGQLVFPNYHVEGQENGRLSCSCEKKRCYNPHSLGSEKVFLKLHNYGNVLFQFDYRNMEVSVLAALSKDDNLLQIVEKPDVYENLFYLITGLKDYPDARSFGKKMFLPIIYGQSPSGLSKSLDISPEQASTYYDKVKSLFPKVFNYVENFQSIAKKEGQVQDCFGRKRSILEEAYKARNFCIQSPSALICLESLIKLDGGSESLYKLAFHVHDGYFVACKSKDMQEVYYRAKKILEQQSEFMPDLKLYVASRVGKSLDKMVPLNLKVKT